MLDGRVRVYDPQSGELMREFSGFSNISEGVFEFNLVISPAGQLICMLVPHVDVDVDDPKVLDPDSGRPLKLPFPLAGIRQVTFDPSGALVATRKQGWGGRRLQRHQRSSAAGAQGQPAATDMAFDPTGRRLVVSGEDRLVRVWDVGTGEPIAAYTGHTGYISRVFVRPIGGDVVSVSLDGTARVWAARRRSAAWTGHTAAVSDLAVSPDGRRVLTASFDGTGRVWDAATGACIHTLRGIPAMRMQWPSAPTGGVRQRVVRTARSGSGTSSPVPVSESFAVSSRWRIGLRVRRTDPAQRRGDHGWTTRTGCPVRYRDRQGGPPPRTPRRPRPGCL